MRRMTGFSTFPIAPNDADGRVDADGLRGLLEQLAAAGIDRSPSARRHLPLLVPRRAAARDGDRHRDHVRPGAAPLVGIDALGTDEAIRLAWDAQAAGAAERLLAAVSYTPLTEAELVGHLEAVAGERGLPLVIYDDPNTTDVQFSPKLIGRIARLPGVVVARCPAPEQAPLEPGSPPCAWQRRPVFPSASAVTGTPRRP